MKKHKRKSALYKKTLSVILAASFCFSYADYDILKEISDTGRVSAEETEYDYSISWSDLVGSNSSDIAVEGNRIVISTSLGFIKLSNTDPVNYYNYTIECPQTTGVFNLSESDGLVFQGLGNRSYPFSGVFKNYGSSLELSGGPLFNSLSTDAEFELNDFEISSKNITNSYLFAGEIVEGENKKALDKIELILPYHCQDFGGLIGTINENTEVSISVVNKVTAGMRYKNAFADGTHIKENDGYFRIERSGDTGLICSQIKEGAKLHIKYYGNDVPDKAEDYNMLLSKSSGGYAGLMVGRADKASIIIENEIKLTGKVVAGRSAGGFIGYSEDTSITFGENGSLTIGDGLDPSGKNKPDLVYSENNSSVTESPNSAPSYYGLSLQGTEYAGGYAGEYRVSESKELDFSNIKATSTVTSAESRINGGLFGSLNNIGDPGTDITVKNCSSIKAYIASANVTIGGIAGQYSTGSLLNSLIVSDSDVLVKTTGSAAASAGGIIGKAFSENGLFIKAENVTSALETNAEAAGGIVGLSEGSNMFDISDIKVSSVSVSGKSGGVCGSMEKGVLRLSGQTDLSGLSVAAGLNCGQILGYRNEALVYAVDGWSFVRPDANLSVSDIGSWGQVVRLDSTDLKENSGSDSLLKYDEEEHTVEICNAGYILKTKRDFAALALSMSCVNSSESLKFDLNKDDYSSYEAVINLESDIDMSGTGVTGLLRDNESQTFCGTINGKNHSLGLYPGEVYGIKNGSVADGSKAGSGQIYNHVCSGLVSRMSGAQIKDIILNGKMNIGTTGLSDIYIGAAAAKTMQTGNDPSLFLNVNVYTDINITGSGGTNSVFAGGITGTLGNRKTNTDELCNATFRNCIWDSDIINGYTEKKIRSNSAPYYIGGFAGVVYGSSLIFVESSEIKGTIKNTTGLAVTESGSHVGGLIAEFIRDSNSVARNDDSLTHSSIHINGLSVNAEISNSNCNSASGGLLGYEWWNCDACFDNITVQDASLVTAGSFGGLICYGSGHWQVGFGDTGKNGITFKENVKIKGKSVSNSPSSIFVAHGEATENDCYTSADNDQHTTGKSLFLEINYNDNDKENHSSFYIGSDAVQTEDIISSDYFDEICGKTISPYGNGVVSIHTDNGKVDTDECNTYKNVLEDHQNPNTRYYYNLDTIRNSKSVDLSDGISYADELMCFSLMNYTNDYLKNYFNINNTSVKKEIKGSVILNGYSFYPIDEINDTEIVISDAAITFGNSGIEQKETIAGNKKTSDKMKQHYMMQTGLFRNVTASELKLSNVSLAGTIGKINSEESGAIISQKAYGKSDRNFSFTVNGLKLDGLSITGYDPSDKSAALIMNAAGSYSYINFSNVRSTSNYNDEAEKKTPCAASSLIGDVGSADAVYINIIFSDIGLNSWVNETADNRTDNNTYSGIFSDSTFLHSFSYSGTTSSGQYNFNKDEVRTFGQELSNSGENGRNPESQYFYFDKNDGPVKDEILSVVSNEGTGFKKENTYLRYVKVPESGDGTSHEIDINLNYLSLEKGRGTYDDPYIINDGGQLDALESYLKGSAISHWNVNFDPEILKNGSGSSSSENTVKYVYDKSSGWNSETPVENVKLSNFTQYLRNAYYLIEPAGVNEDDYYINVGMSKTYTGLGSYNIGMADDSSVNASFSGVIAGKQKNGKNPVINIYSPSGNTSIFGGLVKYASGCVIKDVDIHYAETVRLVSDKEGSGIKVQTNTTDTDANEVVNPEEQQPQNQVFFGGVIGYAFGGDNIIDNVKVTGLDRSVSLSGKYDYLASIGGYVGLVGGNALNGGYGGGVVFRNLENEDNSFTVSAGEKTASAACEADLTIYSDETLDTDADKIIYDAVKNTTLLKNEDQYFYINPFVGRVIDGYVCSEDKLLKNTDKNYTIPTISKGSDSLSFENNVINIKDAQALWLLSSIVNSGAGSIDSSKVYSEAAYKYGKVRNGAYDQIGKDNITISSDPGAENDEKFWGGSETDSEKKLSYLIMLCHPESSKADFSKISSDKNGLTLNVVNDIDISGYGNGFRGIGTGYTDNVTIIVQNRTLSVKTIKGNGNTITLARKGHEYSEETWWTQAEGLFPVYSFDNASCDVNDLTVSGDVKIYYIDKDYLAHIDKSIGSDELENIKKLEFNTDNVRDFTLYTDYMRVKFMPNNSADSEGKKNTVVYQTFDMKNEKSAYMRCSINPSEYVIKYYYATGFATGSSYYMYTDKNGETEHIVNENEVVFDLDTIRDKYNIAVSTSLYVVVTIEYNDHRDLNANSNANAISLYQAADINVVKSKTETFNKKTCFSQITYYQITNTDGRKFKTYKVIDLGPSGSVVEFTKENDKYNVWITFINSSVFNNSNNATYPYVINGKFDYRLTCSGLKVDLSEIRNKYSLASEQHIYAMIFYEYDQKINISTRPELVAQMLDSTSVTVSVDGNELDRITAGGTSYYFSNGSDGLFGLQNNAITDTKTSSGKSTKRYMISDLSEVSQIQLTANATNIASKQLYYYIIDTDKPEVNTKVISSSVANSKYSLSVIIYPDYRDKKIVIMSGNGPSTSDYANSLDGLKIEFKYKNENIGTNISKNKTYNYTAYDSFIGEACLGGYGGLSAYNNPVPNRNDVSQGAQSNTIKFSDFHVKSLNVEGGKYCGGFIGVAAQFNRIYRKAWHKATGFDNFNWATSNTVYNPKTKGSINGNYSFVSCGYTDLNVKGSYSAGGFFGIVKNNRNGSQRKINIKGQTTINTENSQNSFHIMRDAIYEYATHTTIPFTSSQSLNGDNSAKFYCYVGAGGIIGYCDSAFYLNNYYLNSSNKETEFTSIKIDTSYELNNSTTIQGITISAPQISYNSDYGLGVLCGSIIYNGGDQNPVLVCGVSVSDSYVGTPKNENYRNIVRVNDSTNQATYPFAVSTESPSYRNYNAGGIFGYSKSLTYVYKCQVDNVTLVNSPYSGGIISNKSTKELFIVKSKVLNCLLYNSDIMATNRSSGLGGLVGHISIASNLSDNIVSGCTIVSNGSSGGIAGYVNNDIKVTVINNTISENTIVTTRSSKNMAVFNITFEAPGSLSDSYGYKSNETITVPDGTSTEQLPAYYGKAGGLFGGSSGSNSDTKCASTIQGYNISINNNRIGYVLNEKGEAYNYDSGKDLSKVYPVYSFEDFKNKYRSNLISYVNDDSHIGTMKDNGGHLTNGEYIKLSEQNITESNMSDYTAGLDGKIIGKSIDQMTFKLVGVSVIGDKQPVEYNGLEESSTASSYIIRSDYSGYGLSGDANPSSVNLISGTDVGSGANISGTYATTNPYINSSGLKITGDASFGDVRDLIISDTCETERFNTLYSSNISDSESDNSLKKYASEFKDNGIYSDKLTTLRELDKRYTADADIPLLLIDTNISAEINQMIQRYISVMSGTDQMGDSRKAKLDCPKQYLYSSIAAKTYEFRNGKWTAKTDTSLKVEGTGVLTFIRSASGKHDNDNAYPQFTLLDVKYAAPNDTGKTAYHLYIPVYVKRVLAFSVYSSFLNDTDYCSDNYKSNNMHVISNFGDKITEYMTYNYYRSADEWQTLIKGGDNLLWNYNKRVYLGNRKLPEGTVLKLVDVNSGGISYTLTLTGKNQRQDINDKSVGYYVELTDFIRMGQDGHWGTEENSVLICDLLNLSAVNKTVNTSEGGTNEGLFVRLEGEYSASQAVSAGAGVRIRESGKYVYYRPANKSDAADPEKEYFEIKVNRNCEKYQDSKEVNTDNIIVDESTGEVTYVSEEYFMTIETPKNETGFINNLVNYNPDALGVCSKAYINGTSGFTMPSMKINKVYKNDSGADVNEYARNHAENRYIMSNCLIPDFSMETETGFGDSEIMSEENNTINVSMKNKLRFVNTVEDGENILNYLNRGSEYIHIFQNFELSLTEIIETSDTVSAAAKNFADECSVQYYFSVYETGSESTDPLYITPVYEAYPDAKLTFKYDAGNDSDGDLMYLLKKCSENDKNGITVECSVQINYSIDGLINQFPKRISEKSADGIKFNGSSRTSFSEETLDTTSIMKRKTDSRVYFREEISSAKITYSALSIADGDSTGIIGVGQLGVNATDPENDSEIIKTISYYDWSSLSQTEIENAKYISYEISLYAKDENDLYTEKCGIDNYLFNFSVDGKKISESEVSYISADDHALSVSYMKPWNYHDPDNDEISIQSDIIRIDFNVLTGEEFEKKGYKYSNYKLQIRAKLLDSGGTLISGSDVGDYIIYTNSRNIIERYDKVS